MKREKRDDAYLWDMLDAAREARELISGLSYDDLMSRKVVRLALERVLEITGEAARNVSPRRRNRHAIPWQGIIGLRNGNYVVESSSWNGGRGAATWGNGLTGTRGIVSAANSLVGAIAKAKQKPAFLLNASAVGYYGPRGDEIITEDTEPGNDFLSSVCRDWEDEAKKAEPLGLRVIRLRTGIVLGKGDGALPKMSLPFKFFVGGPLGPGNQWMPWIHLDDEVGLMLYSIENSAANGPFNATAPNPERMKEFCQILGKVMRRPSWLRAPAFALRSALGEMAEMLLTGQSAVPAAAQRLGYEFKYPHLTEALQACMPI